jgi:ABC-type transport system involved in multi-copper enzyme maturation permease subunit
MLGALVAGAAALSVFGAVAQGTSANAAKLAGETAQRDMFSATTSGVFFAALAGILVVTNEFHFGTIRPTLLVEPRRRVVLVAKLAAAALVGVLFAVVCVAVSFA